MQLVRICLCCVPATVTAMNVDRDPSANPDDPTQRLSGEILSRATELADALRAAADQIENNDEAGVTEHPDKRREVEFDATLAGIGAATTALADLGDDLIALAAIGGYPMKMLGDLIGLSETAVPIRLGRTPRLAPYARSSGDKARVGRPELGAAAWSYRRGDDISSEGRD